MTEVKKIIICADDYAQSEEISAGILTLATKARINAISCMVNLPSWNAASNALSALKPSVFIGLHLNLTHGCALSSLFRQNIGINFCSLPYLLKYVYLKQLKAIDIAAEIQAQIDAFANALNSYPDFIDGHEHVHQFPVVREALLDVYKANPGLEANLRRTYNGWRDIFSIDGFPKRQILALLGGYALQKQIKNTSIIHNTSFSGIYNFTNAQNYRKYFKRFLANSDDNGLIMCHPGMPSENKSDPLYLSRYHEFNYLMSDNFLIDVANNSCQLCEKKV